MREFENAASMVPKNHAQKRPGTELLEASAVPPHSMLLYLPLTVSATRLFWQQKPLMEEHGR